MSIAATAPGRITTEQPREWFTLAEAARLCHRSEKTIRNLTYEHDVPRRLLWDVRGGVRRRVVMYSPTAVRKLQRLTVEAPVGGTEVPR